MSLIVSNLSGNNHLINNSIYVSMIVNTPLTITRIGYYGLTITRLSDSKTQTFRFFSADYTKPVIYDIAPAIKSMFKDPSHDSNYLTENIIQDNREVFNLMFYVSYYVDNGGEEEEEQETTTINGQVFLRGGDIEKATNLTLGNSQVLSPVKIIPYWENYPTALYTIRNNGIQKNPVISTIQNKEKRLEIGCNSVYIGFLNRYGGFSYWLFESTTKVKQSQNIGLINNPYHKLDLGNKTNYSFQLFSKVPERYYPLMEDLVMSPYILMYNRENDSWTQIQNDNNTLNWVINKKVHEVKLKFKHINYFNGATVWE